MTVTKHTADWHYDTPVTLFTRWRQLFQRCELRRGRG